MGKSTIELENEIKKMSKLEDVENLLVKEGITPRTFGYRLIELCNKKNLTLGELQMKVPMSKSHFYNVIKATRKPTKEAILKIALTLGTTLAETNELLKASGLKELYARNPEDAIIIFGITKGMDIAEIGELLQGKDATISLLDKDR